MKGYTKPNYTQTPNLFLDDHVRQMKEAEIRVALAIVRQTFGWHKDAHTMSITYLQKTTGMSRQGVLNGIADGIERGIIERERDGNSWSYWLAVNEVDQVVNEVDHLHEGQVVNEVDPIKKELKENNHKESNNDSGKVFTFYQSNIGVLTAYDADFIKDAIDIYGGETVIEAMKIAIKANERRWRYVEGILSKWKVQGRQQSQPKQDKRERTIILEDGSTMEVMA